MVDLSGLSQGLTEEGEVAFSLGSKGKILLDGYNYIAYISHLDTNGNIIIL